MWPAAQADNCTSVEFSNMSPSDGIAVVATVFNAISYAPQIFRILQRRHANDISIEMVALHMVASVMWLAYVFVAYSSDVLLITSSLFTITLGTVTIMLTIKFTSTQECDAMPRFAETRTS